MKPERPSKCPEVWYLMCMLAGAASSTRQLRQSSERSWDCPLCVAEEQCHEACARLRRSPGSRYCLEACAGARPGEGFGEDYFRRADGRRSAAEELDARIRRLGAELAADLR
eukprot:CAMPEP_0175437536 /NCGR_PEP_ID=MMETSP0095-20121207/55528_1 /TAXON_ID=311494 /ORGANISM="Alexandrium monilatum, Strain CCMP3105" /LENGTH=111 /DNA_ID=CAMNT_0016737227 /DNA_START=13 /DNA_END=344 /DNA_ORIENTATION=+